MPLTQCVCPECDASLKLKGEVAPGKSIRCPRCGASFRPTRPRQTEPLVAEILEEEEDEAPEVPRKKGKRVADASPRKARAARDSDELPATPRRKKQQTGPPVALLVGGAVVGLLIVGVAGAVVWKMTGTDSNAGPAVAQGPTGNVLPPGPGLPPGTPLPTGSARPPLSTGRVPGDRPGGIVKTPLPPPPPVDPKLAPTLVLDSGGHTDMVTRVFVTRDSKQLITTSADKTVRIWDATSGECLRTLRLPIGPGREGALQNASLSPDNKTLAVVPAPFDGGKLTGMIYLVSLETGQIVRTVKHHTEFVTRVAYSPDGKWLAVSTYNGLVRLYDSAGAGLVKEWRGGHRERVTVLAWSPDSSRLFSGSGDTSGALWTMSSDQPLATLRGHDKDLISAAWAPDGKTLATGGVDGRLILWNDAGRLIKAYQYRQTDPSGPPTGLQLTSLAFGNGGKDLLYTGIGYRGAAGIIDPGSGKQRVEVPHHSNTVVNGAFAPDGGFVVTTGGDDYETCIWLPSNGELLSRLATPGRGIWGVGWSPDGKSIGWGHTNRGDTIQALTRLERSFSLEDFDFGNNPKQEFLLAALEHQGVTLRAADFYTIQVSQNGRKVGDLRSPYERDRIYSVSMLPEARALVGGSYGGVFLFDLTSGKAIRSYKGHTGMILGITPSPSCKHFVTGSSDQTIRVWAVDRDEPVLSLFVAGQDWIAWTPEGYYTASPTGERLMGWQINNGLEAMASYFPAIRFRASLFQPEAMKNLLKAGSIDQALAQAGRQGQAVQVSQVLPPTVEIVSPSPQGGKAEVQQQTLEVKAVARSFASYPVTSMRLLMDGRPYLGSKGVKTFEGGQAGQVEAVWNVALPPGEHTLAVLAESSVSKGMSQTVTVHRTGGKQELPNLYVLAVGISEYAGELKLNYAASDAMLISQTLESRTRGVFGKVEIKRILDRDATKKNIEEGMRWLAEKMSPLDVGVFYFSGHGACDDIGRFYLVPVDIREDAEPEVWGVSGDYVKDNLANMPGRLMAIFDACHSGTVAETFKPGRADNVVRELVGDDYGVIVMCASLGREYALESGATRAGFFTLGLAEALSGRADYNRDRVIHLNELAVYATYRVKDLSKGQQNPIMAKPPHVRSFPVSRP